MARLEITLRRTSAGSTSERRYGLGRIGSVLAVAAAGLLAVAATAAAVLLGYLVAGLLLAALFLGVLLAMLRRAFWSLRQ